METNAVGTAAAAVPSSTSTVHRNAWLMLFSRSALFLAAQALIAVGLTLAGKQGAWMEAARWWILFIILANMVSIYLLVRLYRQEGKRYIDAIRFSRATLKGDLLWFFLSLLVLLPVAAAPMNMFGALIYGDATIPIRALFQPIPLWTLIVGLLFPLTIGFSELPTYFGYSMPRVAESLRSGWVAWLIAAFALALQHVFLPLIPDGRYMLWRLGMYLPFALLTGLFLKFRPSLLPYYMIGHTLIDISILSVYLTI